MGLSYTWNRNGIGMGRNLAEIGLGLEWYGDGILPELRRRGILEGNCKMELLPPFGIGNALGRNQYGNVPKYA